MSEVQKNIAIPSARKKHSYDVSQLKSMEVGDSIMAIATNTEADANRRCSIASTARYIGIKVTTRKVLEDGVWVIRTWRTA